MMVRIDPSMYQKYATYSNKGVPMLYVRLFKALYGMLMSALLLYNILRSDLEDRGFVVNSYDPYVTNKMVGGAQMTVSWNVDDLNISHRYKEMVNAFSVNMANICRMKTIISRGRVQDYIGTELDFGTCPGTFIISMIKYLQKIIDEFPEVFRCTKACPVGDNFLNIRDNEDREILPEEMASQFHQNKAQFLFLCNIARPDIETLVSFLTTRVKYPDVDN